MRFLFGENCPGCSTWMSKADILGGMESLRKDDASEVKHTQCGKCSHVYQPSLEVIFSTGGSRKKEEHKERVPFVDKASLESAVKERYQQGGRRSFTTTILADERCFTASPPQQRTC